MLTKINYKIHTDAIKESIILPSKLAACEIIKTYASEADVLNKALFGMTASDWQMKSLLNNGSINKKLS